MVTDDELKEILHAHRHQRLEEADVDVCRACCDEMAANWPCVVWRLADEIRRLQQAELNLLDELWEVHR